MEIIMKYGGKLIATLKKMNVFSVYIISIGVLLSLALAFLSMVSVAVIPLTQDYIISQLYCSAFIECSISVLAATVITSVICDIIIQRCV